MENDTKVEEETTQETQPVEESTEEEVSASEEDLSSLKQEIKEELLKELEESKAKKTAKRKRFIKKDSSAEKSSEDFGLLQRLALKSEGITEEDEIELAKTLRDETGKEWDELFASKYFKTELQELRDKKSVEKATSGVSGGGSESRATEDPQYWLNKGQYPTREQVPNRQVRSKIKQAFMNSTKSSKMFYND